MNIQKYEKNKNNLIEFLHEHGINTNSYPDKKLYELANSKLSELKNMHNKKLRELEKSRDLIEKQKNAYKNIYRCFSFYENKYEIILPGK